MSSTRVLAILGSGETAPAMSSVHAALLGRLSDAAAAVMLDTPYGFQENADEISRRSANYFARNVRHPVEVLSFRDAGTATAVERERLYARLALAQYVFAGPGSPSYALRQWHGTRVPELLAHKLRTGGVVVFASAAAVGVGDVALPVYEVYKVGEPPRWLPGLNLLAEAGIHAAVIPHYNNAEGGTHDTRYCYMGERRLRLLEASLPAGCSVLGVDEQTACVIDLEAQTLAVRGPGGVTWRVDGRERRWTAGATVQLSCLQGSAIPSPPAVQTEAAAAGSLDEESSDPSALRESALAALSAGDRDGAVAAMLELETHAHPRSASTSTQGAAQAMLRELVVHLAANVGDTPEDPRPRLSPLVSALLAMRDRARAERRFDEADAVRESLREAGVEVQDTPQGSTWQLVDLDV